VDVESLAQRLVGAVGEQRREAGIVISATYQPVGGAEGKIMPPTFPPARQGETSRYLLEERLVDGVPTGTVVIDQPPSQANRVEEALLAARDRDRVSLPIFELVVDGVRLTSLHFPHRYADAYLRDSEVNGVRFDESTVGKTLRSATAEDVRPLFAREPYSLLFGAWDSHRKGRWPRFARLYQSMMFGIDPVVGERNSGRMDPLNLTGAVDDKTKAEGNWSFVAEGSKTKGQRLSEIGHGHIAPNAAHGGVTVREVRRRAWISFAGLERLRFGDAGDEAIVLARATLAALGLLGDRLTFGRPSLWLRSGCDLTLVDEVIGFEVAGGGVESFALTVDEALAVFSVLRQRAAAAGVVMQDDIVAVQPTKQLRDAMTYARTAAVGESA
jgi:CRISPR-associated protein Csb1